MGLGQLEYISDVALKFKHVYKNDNVWFGRLQVKAVKVSSNDRDI